MTAAPACENTSSSRFAPGGGGQSCQMFVITVARGSQSLSDANGIRGSGVTISPSEKKTLVLG